MRPAFRVMKMRLEMFAFCISLCFVVLVLFLLLCFGLLCFMIFGLVLFVFCVFCVVGPFVCLFYLLSGV